MVNVIWCVPYDLGTNAQFRGRPMRGNRKKAKTKQAAKITEIRKALVAAGCDTISKQAAALGLGRSTTYAVLNLDNRAGPSANIVNRILASPNLPSRARTKIQEYVAEKSSGLYGHSERRARAFRDDVLDQNVNDVRSPSDTVIADG